MNVKVVTVIGVTATMGTNISGIFASFGDTKVYCIARDIEKMKKTIPRITKSVKPDGIINNLIPADFSMLDVPTFLGNRIGFQFINEAFQCKEKYAENGGIDYLDAFSGTFTGRALAPIETLFDKNG